MQTRSDIDTLFHEQATVRADQRSEMFETFTVGFRSPVDIQVIGIGRRNNSHIGLQPVEGTVELVRFYHSQITLCGKHQVAVIVLQDTT